MEHVTAHQLANLDVTKHSFTHRIHGLSLWLNAFIFWTEVAKLNMLFDAVSYNAAVKCNKEIHTDDSVFQTGPNFRQSAES